MLARSPAGAPVISPSYTVNQGPSTTVDAIRAELAKYNSPLLPYAQRIYDLGRQYNVDPAFFMGTVYGENWYGTYPGNGAYDVASGTGSYNWASISNALYGGYPVAGTRWGQYPTPDAGIEAFFRLLTTEYFPAGQTSLDRIWWGLGGSCDPCIDGRHAYGPCSDNHGNCSSLNTVLTVMNRIGDSSSIVNVCQPGTVLDPTGQLCVPAGIGYTQPQETPALAIAVGLALLAGGGILAWRSLQ